MERKVLNKYSENEGCINTNHCILKKNNKIHQGVYSKTDNSKLTVSHIPLIFYFYFFFYFREMQMFESMLQSKFNIFIH